MSLQCHNMLNLRKVAYFTCMKSQTVKNSDSQKKVQGTRGKVQGSRFKVEGSRGKVQGTRFKVQGERGKRKGARGKGQGEVGIRLTSAGCDDIMRKIQRTGGKGGAAMVRVFGDSH